MSEKTVKPRDLVCCCCGVYTKGRQWHNRDNGYGICPVCAGEQIIEEGAETMQSYYGRKGYHYDIIEPEATPSEEPTAFDMAWKTNIGAIGCYPNLDGTLYKFAKAMWKSRSEADEGL